MRAMNRAFVTDSAQRKRIAQVLRAISKADGPVLIHCTAGKDRTGWVSAMLHEDRRREPGDDHRASTCCRTPTAST